MRPAPLLVFGWGNASRGDDALGPLFVERLRARADSVWGKARARRIEFLEDYQLQVEHALDLVGREQVLFVDASLEAPAPFTASTLQRTRDLSFTTHAMSPQAVMQVFHDLHRTEPPACTLLAIRGLRFGLGEAPGPDALRHLDAALDWGRRWMEAAEAPLPG